MPNVASISAAVAEMQPAWDLCDALLDGTDEMRQAGQKYLPKWPAEDDEAYKTRCKIAVLFPAFSRSVQTLAAKPFSKPLTLDGIPAAMQAWLENVDLEGRNLAAFAACLMEQALGLGLCGILVEYPDASTIPVGPSGVRTLADERAAGLRPYFVHIEPDQLLGWRVGTVNGVKALTQLRIMECVTEPDGEWGEVEVEQVRVLTPGAWQVYRRPGASQNWDEAIVYAEGTTTLPFIPFVPVYGKREGYMEACPPLMELAHLNVEHWQSSSYQRNALNVARVPILVVKAVQEGFAVKVSASYAVNLGPNPDADIFFVEHKGEAIGAGAEDLKTLEERMRQAGAELLVIDQKLTATQVTTENAVGMCALQRITLDLQDALNTALAYMAQWQGLDTSGTVKLFNDFGFGTLAEATAELIRQLAGDGTISKETAFEELQRRGVIDSGRKWRVERDRIETQGPSLGTLGMPAPALQQGAAAAA